MAKTPISTIDLNFQDSPQVIASYVIRHSAGVALIESGPGSTRARLQAGLAELGFSPRDVTHVLLTHIHLDHAGGAGLLMSKLPNAQLTVHPRGARHMTDPGKLTESTNAVYGAEAARRIFGEIMPVPRSRIIETAHGSSLKLNGREFVFFDTPGHARHHVCVLDTRARHLFAGDTFGLSYREFDCDGRQFAFPTTSPVHFDPAAAHRSLDLILGLKPGAIYVTHYSQVRDIARMGADMHRLIDAHVQLARRERDAGQERHRRLKAGVTKIVRSEAQRHQWRLPHERVIEVLAGDIELNALGLGVWLDTQVK